MVLTCDICDHLGLEIASPPPRVVKTSPSGNASVPTCELCDHFGLEITLPAYLITHRGVAGALEFLEHGAWRYARDALAFHDLDAFHAQFELLGELGLYELETASDDFTRAMVT